MILPISIDLEDIIKEFSLNESQANSLGAAIIDKVIEEYTLKWENLIGSTLHQTRSDYKKAVFIQRTSPLDVTFGLSARENNLAISIEEGAPPFDEKAGFQASNKTKPSKSGGWYLTIPFRHATPTAVAESGVFASILPQVIYDIAKEKSPVQKVDLPPEYQAVGKRSEINVPGLVVPEYVHQAPKYQGLVKINIASTDKEKRNEYMTFRRVSDKSDPLSWWHPGFVPKKLMDKALEQAQIDTVADIAIDKFLQNI